MTVVVLMEVVSRLEVFMYAADSADTSASPGYCHFVWAGKHLKLLESGLGLAFTQCILE